MFTDNYQGEKILSMTWPLQLEELKPIKHLGVCVCVCVLDVVLTIVINSSTRRNICSRNSLLGVSSALFIMTQSHLFYLKKKFKKNVCVCVLHMCVYYICIYIQYITQYLSPENIKNDLFSIIGA